MTVAVSTWLQDILPRTPGLVRAVAKREFMLACREFFEQSFAWREVLGPSSVVAGTASYPQSPVSADILVAGILSVEYGGRSLYPRSRKPAGEVLTGLPDSYYIDNVSTVVLCPTPLADAASVLNVYVALTPNLTSLVLPDIADTLFRDALLDGVLARLYAHPAKPYSNPLLAQHHAQRFRAAMGNYTGRAKTGQTGVAPWQFPRFAK